MATSYNMHFFGGLPLKNSALFDEELGTFFIETRHFKKGMIGIAFKKKSHRFRWDFVYK